MTQPTPRQFLRRRARQNPPLWHAIQADAHAVAASLTGRTSPRRGLGALWLVLEMAWQADGFLPLVLCRTATAVRALGVPFVPTLLRRLAIATGQVHIGAPVILEPGLVLPHGQVVIDGLTHIGAGATIMPFTTIGLIAGEYQGPTLDARITVGTGAKILGPVRIGKGAKVGANAVVLTDVPPGCTAVGVPARVSKPR